jgi:hypothetical protein
VSFAVGGEWQDASGQFRFPSVGFGTHDQAEIYTVQNWRYLSQVGCLSHSCNARVEMSSSVFMLAQLLLCPASRIMPHDSLPRNDLIWTCPNISLFIGVSAQGSKIVFDQNSNR